MAKKMSEKVQLSSFSIMFEWKSSWFRVARSQIGMDDAARSVVEKLSTRNILGMLIHRTLNKNMFFDIGGSGFR